MKKINVYSVIHKDYPNMLKSRKYIGVGNNKNIQNVEVYDSYGEDNLSIKNKNYAELTALYWIWKNDNSDYIGLEHYRRFFYHKYLSVFKYIPVSKRKMVKYLKKYDVILPERIPLSIFGAKNIFEFYKTCHYGEDLETAGKVIKQMYPEYSEDFDTVMNLDSIFLCNMFVMSKELLNKYCNWIFPIFSELEKIFDMDKYKDNQTRVFGFMGERLFNVWIHHQNVRIKHLGVCKLEESPLRHWAKMMLNHHFTYYIT